MTTLPPPIPRAVMQAAVDLLVTHTRQMAIGDTAQLTVIHGQGPTGEPTLVLIGVGQSAELLNDIMSVIREAYGKRMVMDPRSDSARG